jgi:tyrosyl-tRNA synthetase
MMDIDIEVGGNDQLFNMLAGRDMVMNHLGKEKFVLASKLLETTDGTKMGKTTGNMVRLDEDPKDIYGKIMASPDELIMTSFEILTVADFDELDEYKKRLDSGENPIELKKELAFRVTSELKGEEDAKLAQQYFENIFQNNTEDENIEEKEIEYEEITLLDLLVQVEFAPSKSKARQLIEQGAVKIDDEKRTDWQTYLKLHTMQPFTLKVGKKICRILPKI